MIWTDERVAELKRLNDGRSGSEIAKALGGVTRCAVISKLKRLGIPIVSASKVPIAPRKERAALERKIADQTTNSAIRNTLIARSISMGELPPTERVMLPLEENKRPPVALLDLQPSMCRWPISDDADNVVGFCGEQQGGLGQYCCRHAVIAYTQPRVYIENNIEYLSRLNKSGAMSDVMDGGWMTGFRRRNGRFVKAS